MTKRRNDNGNGNILGGPASRGTPSIYVGRRRLGADAPAYIVAEIGLNHCGHLEKALKLIEEASEVGADAVKFQKRSPEDLLSRSAYDQPYHNSGNSFGPTYGRHRKALEFNLEQYVQLRQCARDLEVDLFASVWDQRSLEDMDRLGIPVIKIGSPDLTNEPLIHSAALRDKPLFISTGMCDEEEIDHAVSVLYKLNTNFVLFHCVSIYPTPPELAKLSTLNLYQKKYGVPVGYSGHELDISIAVAARTLGACVIEKHFTLDRSWKGGDQKVSLLPCEFRKMVQDIRTVELALDGVRSHLIDGERYQREKLGKSVVARRDLRAGEILRRDMVACKCPGGGVSPQHLPQLLGRQLLRPIKEDDYILPTFLRRTHRDSIIGASLGDHEHFDDRPQ